MNQLPFSVYDFFGYLASGAVVMVGVTTAFIGYDPLRHAPGVLIGLFFVICAYIVGQIVANLAGDLIERRIVRDRLRSPTGILLGTNKLGRVSSTLLPGYGTSLPCGVQTRIKEGARRRGVGNGDPDSLFFHCHAVMKSDSTVQERLETFNRLYGFCRNMALALAIVMFCLLMGIVLHRAETGPDVGPGWWVALALIGAVGMFYRYLKFYRQYAVELLTSYAEVKA